MGRRNAVLFAGVFPSDRRFSNPLDSGSLIWLCGSPPGAPFFCAEVTAFWKNGC